LNARFRTYGSIAITIVLLYLVIRQVGADELVAVIRDGDPRQILLAFVIGHLSSIPQALKGQILLRARGHAVPLLDLLKLYFVGIFFNNFLPSNVGGDVVRGYEIGRRIGDAATGMAAVFVERLTGLVVLVAFALIAFLTRLDLLQNPVLASILAVATTGLIALAWLALDSRLLEWTSGTVARGVPVHLINKVRKFQTALHRYRGHPRALATVFLLSMIFYGGAVAYVIAAISAFHSMPAIWGTMFIVPIAMVVAMIPLSFNGVGLMEWSYVLLFPTIGVPGSVALSAMLLIRIITLFSSLVGGLCYLQLKANRREPISSGKLAS
jgi:uncharacterized protein (TIRG00374 family)